MSELGTALLTDIQDSFMGKITNDRKLKQIANKIRDGTDYDIANDYSIRIGELLSESVLENTGTLAYMSEDLAREVLTPVLTANHNMVAEATNAIQTNMNEAEGIRLGVQTPELDTNRIEGLVNKVASYETYEQAKWVMGEPVVNYSQSVVDQAIRDNARVTNRAGGKAYIIRETEAPAVKTGVKRVRSPKGKVYSYPYKYREPCPWCESLAGKYDYDELGMVSDVYRRHEACRCKLTFVRGNTRQNVWNQKEVWTEKEAKEQIQNAEDAMPKEAPIPKNDIVDKLGEPVYRLIDNHVQNVSENHRAVWKKYENDIMISDSKARGTAYARGQNVHFNIANDLNPTRKDQKELQVFFHETHHAIDHLAGQKESGAFHFSSQYKNHLFPDTIVNEVQELIKARGEQVKALIKNGDIQTLRDNGLISDWVWHYTYGEDISKVKYSKSMAYAMLQNEVRELPDVYRGDLSDILEGATNGKISCGYGHGKKYWTDRTFYGVRDGLATEAFAEMSDSTFSNPESLEAIKQYLPKSYAVYEEMIEYLAK